MGNIEQQNLVNNRAAVGFRNAAPVSGIITGEQNIPALTCPSRGARTWEFQGNFNDRWAQGDYASYAGTLRFGIVPPNRVLPALPEGNPLITPVFWSGLIANGGMTGGRRGLGGSLTEQEVDFGDIGFGSLSDGSSNTIMLMEKSADSRNYSGVYQGNFFDGIGVVGGWYSQGNHTNARFFSGLIPDNQMRDLSSGQPVNEQGFGSPHPGTTNAVLGDGSTHAVSNTADLDSFHDLLNRNDGFPTGVDDI